MTAVTGLMAVKHVRRDGHHLRKPSSISMFDPIFLAQVSFRTSRARCATDHCSWCFHQRLLAQQELGR